MSLITKILEEPSVITSKNGREIILENDIIKLEAVEEDYDESDDGNVIVNFANDPENYIQSVDATYDETLKTKTSLEYPLLDVTKLQLTNISNNQSDKHHNDVKVKLEMNNENYIVDTHDVCPDRLTYSKNLHQCILSNLKVSKPCNKCDKIHLSDSSLKEPKNTDNINNNHKLKARMNSVCSNSINLNNCLGSRMGIGKKLFTCDVCQKTFTLLQNLHRHTVAHSNKRPYICDVCKKAFTRQDHLKNHRKIHSGIKNYVCDICEKGFTNKSYLRQHNLIHSMKKSFFCDLCGKAFNRKVNLQEHISYHSSKQPHKVFKCVLCDKKFNRASILYKHTLSHEQEKSFCSDVCGKVFTKDHYFNLHMKTHKSYVCNVCNRDFKGTKELNIHKKIHNNV